MSKYPQIPSDSNDYGSQLTGIANELAERNRLKKIEIVYGNRAGNMSEERLIQLLDLLINGREVYDIYEDDKI